MLRRNRRGDRSVEAETDGAAPKNGAPSIGIALSGGAARGFAHIGVLQTLLKHGLRPEIVAGTSMGAVIGGCYAAGQLEATAEWACSLTRRRILGYLDVSLAGSGLINGSRLARQLERTIGKIKIEALDIHFAAIATEIDTGHEVWLTRGRLLEALRASYALPGVFAPVRIGNRWLLDGALVNPVPVSAARALDARLVIGVNANADLLGRGATIHSHGFDDDEPEPVAAAGEGGWRARRRAEKLLRRKLFGHAGRPGLPTVMIEAYNVMQDRITRARLAGDPADIMIGPRLGDIGMFDFHRAEEAIQIGAEAAERSLDQIEQAIKALA
ncbi:MAG: phospholipase [Rhizobiales bacterium]|nr:phospholipase [Hyphomicrobiales bacterium]